jgi:alkanesulfonate monooxygenase SsuD/methylene tetrahydromethanopterin reductase-like flavin-dependent oxidoreductase (luciferase family)
VPHYIERFRTGREACGIAMEPESAQFGLHTYVGESKAEAPSTASQAFDRYIAVRTNAQRRSYEEIVSKGLALFGSADEVRDQLIHMVDLGATHLLTIQSFGLIADAKVQKSMERLSKSVLPSVLQHARSSKGNTSARVSEPIATARQA